jgi:hypothetical protein
MSDQTESSNVHPKITVKARNTDMRTNCVRRCRRAYIRRYDEKKLNKMREKINK